MGIEVSRQVSWIFLSIPFDCREVHCPTKVEASFAKVFFRQFCNALEDKKLVKACEIW